MNAELKKFVGKVKQAQTRIQKMVQDQDWLDEARKYAERQGTEVKKLFAADSSKVEAFLERQKKELERIQKRIPGEVKKYRSLLHDQSRELEKVLSKLVAGGTPKKKKTSTKKKGAPGAKRKKKTSV